MDYIDRLKSVCCTLIDEAQPIVCHDGDKEYVISEETLEELQIALSKLETSEFI
jgi:hypothetical protein